MADSAFDWHARYLRQATWTAQLRAYVFSLIEIESGSCILDVGCGTGALLSELERLAEDRVIGIDISRPNLKIALANQGRQLVQGDGLELPFGQDTFDITLCHFLLLWVRSPSQCLQEMHRVTRTGGWVLALAEPDYGGRIDHPSSLGVVGEWQRDALASQGANVKMGRQLLGLFKQSGLENISCGVLGGQWRPENNPGEWLDEWRTLEQDLYSLRFPPTSQEVQIAYEAEINARKDGIRILYVPTFYAMGQVTG